MDIDCCWASREESKAEATAASTAGPSRAANAASTAASSSSLPSATLVGLSAPELLLALVKVKFELSRTAARLCRKLATYEYISISRMNNQFINTCPESSPQCSQGSTLKYRFEDARNDVPSRLVLILLQLQPYLHGQRVYSGCSRSA
jgi:hypothetical protein